MDDPLSPLVPVALLLLWALGSWWRGRRQERNEHPQALREQRRWDKPW